MDQVDVKMLELLHENARIPVAEMSRQINMSQPALTERLRKLEDQGTISGYRVQLSPPKLGMHSSAFVLFRTNRCPDFIAFCEKSPVVIDLLRIRDGWKYRVRTVMVSNHVSPHAAFVRQ
ncbi:AsnC family transcriptional regulator [Paenibacillus thalictri]|uniref:AsnC family transcriptional regulator n=1 Tax=Paenibacillus thalictri TaxID=2527873 RepID=A0A4Q9DJW9_9BACL|nr:AsnC family transcriptional regulator [Paenibacillus thalictri]